MLCFCLKKEAFRSCEGANLSINNIKRLPQLELGKAFMMDNITLVCCGDFDVGDG